MNTSDVIVVGGGVVGCAVAYYLAREGLSVLLCERGELASQASGAAAGMLAPICESDGEGPFFDFALHGLRLFPEVVDELKERSGIDPQFVRSGVLHAAREEAEAHALRIRAARLGQYGVEWLSTREAREREPHLAEEIHGALWSPEESHVYSPLMTRAYAQAAAQLGARIEQGTPVLGLIRDKERVLGIKTALGERGAGHVVLCAGAWTRFCAEWLGERLPIEPVRGQILALDAPHPAFRSILWDEHVYLVPKRDGRIIVGATMDRVGYDCRTTASAVAGLLSHAVNLAPALADCTFRHAWAGLRPDTPDHLPALGPVPGVEGVSIAAGHFRNGVLLSAATGELMANWIVRHAFPASAAPFLPERLLRHVR